MTTLERKAAEWARSAGDAEGGSAAPAAAVADLADEGLAAVKDAVEDAGAAPRAGAEAAEAVVQGESPLRAVLTATWRSGTPTVRAAMITAVVAAIVLVLVSPVLAVVFLVSLAIAAAVHRTRAH